MELALSLAQISIEEQKIHDLQNNEDATEGIRKTLGRKLSDAGRGASKWFNKKFFGKSKKLAFRQLNDKEKKALQFSKKGRDLVTEYDTEFAPADAARGKLNKTRNDALTLVFLHFLFSKVCRI